MSTCPPKISGLFNGPFVKVPLAPTVYMILVADLQYPTQGIQLSKMPPTVAIAALFNTNMK